MISVVVPTFDERLNIESLVRRAGTALLSTGEAFELIIVDDDSPDGTADAVRSLQGAHPWLKLCIRKKVRGLATAVVTGWQISRGDVLGCMAADLRHPPEILPQLLERLRTFGADIVVASGRVCGGGVRGRSVARVSFLGSPPSSYRTHSSKSPIRCLGFSYFAVKSCPLP